MRELSLHILDIVQNSLAANASLVIIKIFESVKRNLLRIEIQDNGCGLTQEQIQRVLDPFYTTRSTRKVGLGLSMFQAAAEQSGGHFQIQSEPGKGTLVSADFKHDDIDRAPLGDMVKTIITLVVCNPEVDFCYHHYYESNSILFDTRELKRELSISDLTVPKVIQELKAKLTWEFSQLYQTGKLS